MIYGYCRISTSKQNIERQVRNILAEYPDAIIVKEIYTGTKKTGRKELEHIISKVQEGDTIIFDSVSRMSRNAAEGIALYMELYSRGINLVFLKEPYINTDTYKLATQEVVQTVGNDIADIYIRATNEVLLLLAEKQIRQTFEQSEKEISDLHKHTKEGLETARRNGKQVGQQAGRKLNVKKAVSAKEIIRKHSKNFGGTLSDTECIRLSGVSRNTYYKYKKEISEEK